MATTIGSLDLNAFNNLYSDSTQYFWFESNASATYGAGVHVTLVPDATFISNPTGQNILMNTDGFSIRNGLLPMMTLDNDSLDFNAIDTTQGTYTKMATFGLSGMQVYSRNSNNSLVQLANVGYGDTQGEATEVTSPYYTFGIRRDSTTPYSSSRTYDIGAVCVYDDNVYVCISDITTPEAWNIDHWQLAHGSYSFTEGVYTLASGYCSHAEGSMSRAIGNSSHVEGSASYAIGVSSHAEGYGTNAIEEHSHAEGTGTNANGKSSHAEGNGTTAGGLMSHAEGDGSTASGHHSHAQNKGTISHGKAQTAIGTFNVEDTTPNTPVHPSGEADYDNYAFIIGNGTYYDSRSNALTVDWNGNVETAGAIYNGAGYYANGALLGSCMTLTGESNTTITLSTSYKYPTLSVVKESFGNAFVKSSNYNGIECQYSGIVMLQASFRVYNNFTASDIINYGIYNYTKSEDCTGGRFRVPPNQTAPNQDAHTRTCFVRVSAGDVIRARIQNATGSRGVLQVDNTFLTACYIGAIT